MGAQMGASFALLCKRCANQRKSSSFSLDFCSLIIASSPPAKSVSCRRLETLAAAFLPAKTEAQCLPITPKKKKAKKVCGTPTGKQTNRRTRKSQWRFLKEFKTRIGDSLWQFLVHFWPSIAPKQCAKVSAKD